jgi:hypothetical protein
MWMVYKQTTKDLRVNSFETEMHVQVAVEYQ